MWIEHLLNLTIQLEATESAFYNITPEEEFNSPEFKHNLFSGEDVENIKVIYTHCDYTQRYRGINGKDCMIRDTVIYRKILEFVNPNAPDTNKTRIDKFPPTKTSEVDNYKRRFIETFNGRPFLYENNNSKFYVSITVNNYQVLVSPALEAILYSNEEIAAANVLAQRQQERQEANKVVAKGPLAGTGVSGIVKSFLGGRRYTRQSRRKSKAKNYIRVSSRRASRK